MRLTMRSSSPSAGQQAKPPRRHRRCVAAGQQARYLQRARRTAGRVSSRRSSSQGDRSRRLVARFGDGPVIIDRLPVGRGRRRLVSSALQVDHLPGSGKRVISSCSSGSSCRRSSRSSSGRRLAPCDNGLVALFLPAVLGQARRSFTVQVGISRCCGWATEAAQSIR